MPEDSFYRLRKPTLAIYYDSEGERRFVTIPVNSTIRLLDGCLEDSRLVKVSWDNRVVMLFAKDFDERAILTVRSLAG
jgi:hypothetical protein